MNTSFKIDWLALTVWGTPDYATRMWNDWLAKYLGEPVEMGHGGRGFKKIAKGLAGAKLYLEPANEQGNYFHIELPASACDAIPPVIMSEMIRELMYREKMGGSKFKVTRMDLAWNGVNFTPQDFLKAVEDDHIRTLAKRETTRVDSSPMALRDDGKQGTTTVYLGSRTSTRSVRVYDKRGFTRVELEVRHERANEIARLLLYELPEKWVKEAIGHLRDYMDIYDDKNKVKLVSWWEELVMGIVRSNLTVSDAGEVELVRIQKWMVFQVAPALSVLEDTVGEGVLEMLVTIGRVKRGDRYKHLLENIKPEKPLKKTQGVLRI